jgi:hypothetical protein
VNRFNWQKRVAIAWDPTTQSDQMEAAKTAAGLVGIETLVLEVVRPKSDILVGVFGPLADSCTATSTIPIVIEAAGDAVASGLVASCSRPRIREAALCLARPPTPWLG